MSPQRAPSLWPSLAWCAVAAIIVDLGRVHRGHDADSLVPVLVSLQRWTPFYWEQDRIGMLLPLLAMPFRDPLVNLLVQDGVAIFCGLAAGVLLARWAVAGLAWPAVGLTGAAVALLCLPEGYLFEFLINQPYGVSFTLALGGLLLAEPGARGRRPLRLTVALGLLTVAHWVNVAVGLPLLACAGLFALCSTRRGTRMSHAAAPVVLLLVAMGIGLFMMRTLPRRHSGAELVPVHEWPAAWTALGRQLWEVLAPAWFPFLILASAVAGAALLTIPSVRRRSGQAALAALVLSAAAGAYWASSGMTLWVRLNLFNFRYLMPTVLLLQTAVITITLAPACEALGARARGCVHAGIAAVLILAALLVSGPPSVAQVREEIARRHGTTTADVIDAGCTHVIGSYWKVWPTVFHANAVLHERGAARPLWGITLRSKPTRRLWDVPPRRAWRLCAENHDSELEGMRRLYGLPRLEQGERIGTITVYRVPVPARP